jgi:hypothetical protein
VNVQVIRFRKGSLKVIEEKDAWWSCKSSELGSILPWWKGGQGGLSDLVGELAIHHWLKPIKWIFIDGRNGKYKILGWKKRWSNCGIKTSISNNYVSLLLMLMQLEKDKCKMYLMYKRTNFWLIYRYQEDQDGMKRQQSNNWDCLKTKTF